MTGPRPAASPDALAGRAHYVLGIKLLVLMTAQATAQHSFAGLTPFIRDDLDLGAAELGLVSAALYLGTVIAAFGLGGWVDRRPARLVALVTGSGVALSLVVVAASPWLLGVTVGFLLIGISRGAIPPLTDRLGYELVPVQRRGVVFGIKQTGAPLGSIVAGMVLPPIAASAAGWRGSLVAAAALIAAIALVVSRSLAVSERAPRQVPDRPTDGAVEGAGAVMLRLLGLLVTPTVFSFGIGLFMAASMTFLALYLVDVGGLDAVRAARWFAAFGIGGAFGRIGWGWLSDNVFAGRRAYALAMTSSLGGLAAILIGLAPGLLVGVRGVLLVAVFGFFAQGWVGIVRALGAELAGPGYSGRAGGLLLGSMMLGGFLGPPIFGGIVEFAGGYAAAWVSVGGVALTCAALMLLTARRERTITNTSPDPASASDREAER